MEEKGNRQIKCLALPRYLILPIHANLSQLALQPGVRSSEKKEVNCSTIPALHCKRGPAEEHKGRQMRNSGLRSQVAASVRIRTPDRRSRNSTGENTRRTVCSGSIPNVKSHRVRAGQGRAG